MIKAIIIDDEKHALEMLEWQLKQYCPQVQLLALCSSADEGIDAIRTYQPTLVFLDIEMPHKNGFEVVKQFPDPPFDIVFTTAYNQFAIQAFKVAALDYLVKPIDADDLVKTVKRFEKKQSQHSLKKELIQLMQEYKPVLPVANRVPLPTADGILFADPMEISRAEASSNYATIHFLDKTKLLLAKTLKDIEDLFSAHSFIRIHQSHLVNTAHIHKYSKADGGAVLMRDGTRLPVSRQRKEELNRLFSKGE